jgi:gamma-glutamyltranspeptidase/glutathione hydrolase
VAALCEALAKYGTLSLAQVMAPAIALAQEGVPIGPRHAGVLNFWRSQGLTERFPETASIQFPPPDQAIESGWLLRQADLAQTLRAISRKGPDAFYKGPIAQAMVDETQRMGGILSLEDLAQYRPKTRQAIRGSYRGLQVFSFPPPSSGGVALVEILNILEGLQLSERSAGSSASIHLIAEAMKLAFADRAAHLGDSDFVSVPVEGLISKSYADSLRRRINPPWFRRAPWFWFRSERALSVKAAGQPPVDGGTSHLSVADAQGNAVAITQTINLLFGSGVTVPGTGILLNNEMDDFAKAPGVPNAFGLVDTTGANAIAPGKRPLSSMTPSILLKDGKLFMVTGSPGGPRIITTTLLSILNVVDYGMNAQQAVAASRFHHQWLPDKLVLEPDVPQDVIRALEKRGHHTEVSSRWWSSAQVILFDHDRGLFFGGSDPRSDGAAMGPHSLEPPLDAFAQ